jgi:transketolase
MLMNIMRLKKRILEISIKYKLSHLNSCLSSVETIYKIYQTKKDNERFVLSNGHAALALYVVLEDKYGVDAETLWHESGTHPCRGEYIDCSTGSLGMGLPIAVGMALADRSKNVYCLLSDGECDEGSIWESLRFLRLNCMDNVKIFVNINGFSAYNRIDIDYLINRLISFYDVEIVRTNTGDGWDDHYYTPRIEDYETNFRRLSL